MMEIKIGIQSVPRELVVETETSAAEIEQRLTDALASAPENGAVISIEVRNGGKVLIPAAKIAYLEFTGSESRRVGFGNIV